MNKEKLIKTIEASQDTFPELESDNYKKGYKKAKEDIIEVIKNYGISFLDTEASYKEPE